MNTNNSREFTTRLVVRPAKRNKGMKRFMFSVKEQTGKQLTALP
jgi:hypothetical protein